MTSKTEAQQRAQEKYMEKTARIEITMPTEKKDRIKEHVSETGESVNRFINRAISETMERDTKAPEAETDR